MRVCSGCAAGFEPRHHLQRYCEPACRKASKPAKVADCLNCDQPLVQKANETSTHFAKRQHCNRQCSAEHRTALLREFAE